MWIIVGLGNPGTKYYKTRHNIGYRVINLLSDKFAITLKKNMLYSAGKGLVEGIEVMLVKPLTYMNRSGQAIKNLLFDIEENNDKSLVVVHDDIDLDVGVLRIKKKGSSGGHKGVESIIQQIHTDDFIRVKIGIGRSNEIPMEEYVLSKFSASEENIINNSIVDASSAVIRIVTKGVDAAMNEFNRKKQA